MGTNKNSTDKILVGNFQIPFIYLFIIIFYKYIIMVKNVVNKEIEQRIGRMMRGKNESFLSSSSFIRQGQWRSFGPPCLIWSFKSVEQRSAFFRTNATQCSTERVTLHHTTTTTFFTSTLLFLHLMFLFSLSRERKKERVIEALSVYNLILDATMTSFAACRYR